MKNLWIFRNSVHPLSDIGHLLYCFYNNILNHKTVTHGIIRKVLGSSAGNIVVLLSRDLLKPVFIATCIAIPLGYTAMNNWLNNFAYRTPMHW